MCGGLRPFARAVGGVCGGRALGAADAGAGGRNGGRVRPDKHFFAWTVAALPPLPEAPSLLDVSWIMLIFA